MSSGRGLAVAPGGVFVVSGVVFQAAVQDADPPVAEGSQGLVVGVAGGSACVVVVAGAGAGLEGAEGPLVDRVIEPLVAGVAGQDGNPVSYTHLDVYKRQR